MQNQIPRRPLSVAGFRVYKTAPLRCTGQGKALSNQAYCVELRWQCTVLPLREVIIHIFSHIYTRKFKRQLTEPRPGGACFFLVA